MATVSLGPRPTVSRRCSGTPQRTRYCWRPGIARAKGLVAALGSDASNIFLTLSARVLNPKLLIVARSGSEDTVNKLVRAGADNVVTPYGLGGKRMATLMLKPLVSDYLDVVTGGGELQFRVEEVELAGDCCVIGRSIGDMEIRREDRGDHPGPAARGHRGVRDQSVARIAI